MSMLGFVRGSLLCDFCCQFRLSYFVALPICVVILLALGARPQALICLAAFLLNAIPVINLLTPTACSTPNDKAARSLTILDFNTEFQHNSDCASFIQQLVDRSPDVFALVEVDQAWIDGLKPALRLYPFRTIVIDGPGLAIFSRYPFEHVEVRHFGKSHHPRILGRLLIGDQHLNFLVAHPTTPKNSDNFKERNEEISLIASELETMPDSRILIADLNCSPWSGEFARLLQAGLNDSEQGFGAQPSWPARVGRIVPHIPIPPIIPIDHILVSKNVCVLRRQVGPAIHSDHLPVTVQILIPK